MRGKINRFLYKVAQTTKSSKIIERLLEWKTEGPTEDWFIKRKIAENINVSQEILHKLSYHHTFTIRLYVLKNPNVSNETLMKMKKDTDRLIRYESNYILNKRLNA